MGQPLMPVPGLTARMVLALAANSFTKAGLNMALWDALGRTLGLRVTELLGGPLRTEIPVKMSLCGDGDRLAGALPPIDGRFARPPDGPGLGTEPGPEVIARFS